jgi:phosphatidylglycerophosphate synthase
VIGTGLPPYVYRCVDRSRLVDLFRERWVPLFDWWLPGWLPANLVTIGASAWMWAVFGLELAAGTVPPPLLAVAFVVLFQLYVIYDHADGMHAKRTHTSSPLGEYLDHALDALNGAISVLAVFALVGDGNRLLVFSMLWCWQAAFAATMVDEKERGELYLEMIGSLEGVLLFSAFFLSWLVPPVRAWWLAPLVGGVPAFSLAVAAGGATTLSTVARSVRRMGRLPARFAIFLVSSLLIALLLALGPQPFWIDVAVVVLYGSDYTARVIGSHLLRRSHPLPDLVAPVAVAVASVAPWRPASWAGVLATYLALRAAAGALGVLLPMRSLWRWSNT